VPRRPRQASLFDANAEMKRHCRVGYMRIDKWWRAANAAPEPNLRARRQSFMSDGSDTIRQAREVVAETRHRAESALFVASRRLRVRSSVLRTDGPARRPWQRCLLERSPSASRAQRFVGVERRGKEAPRCVATPRNAAQAACQRLQPSSFQRNAQIVHAKHNWYRQQLSFSPSATSGIYRSGVCQ